MNVASYLEGAALRSPEQPAIVAGGRVVSYGEWCERAAKVAGLLAAAGVQPGDRVAVLLPNSVDFLDALFGTLAAGAVIVPIGTRLHPKEWTYVLRHSESSVLIYDEGFAEDVRKLGLEELGVLGLCAGEGPADDGRGFRAAVDAAQPIAQVDREPADLAWLFYTSGTTGHPKGAMVTHGNLAFMTECYRAEAYRASPDDRALHAGPLTHGSGLWAISLTEAGATHVLPTSASFDPAEIYALIARHGVTKIVFLSPTMVKMLVDSPAAEGADCSTLRFVGYGGAPMHQADLRAAIGRWGFVLANIYGQGECPMTISVLSPADHEQAARERPERLSSAGPARGGIIVTVCDDGGCELEVGEVGEVCVEGPVVMKGYWRDEAATAEVFRGGRYHTGDLGRFDEDGFLYLLDRKKELVISGGSNVYPREVEKVLLGHEAVREVAVFGVPDRFWGESVVAVVVPRAGQAPSDEELIELCRRNLASYKKPRWIFLVDELPRNPTGKVLKRELAQHYAGVVGDGAK